MATDIFNKDFNPRPFWWEAHEPRALPAIDLPKTARVVIVGAGYAGLNAALELTRAGLDCVVLDANEPGFGGSTRSGGIVSGGINVEKRYAAKPMAADKATPFIADAADSFTHVENLIARENIDCGWQRAGYYKGAWCKSHYAAMAKKVDTMNRFANAEAFLVPPERQREEIARISIAAAWSRRARRIFIPHSITRACSAFARSTALALRPEHRPSRLPKRVLAGWCRRRAGL